MERNLGLEEIYQLYFQDVYQYVFSFCKNVQLTEDIVQETFYRAYFYVESYDDEKIKPWLFKVAYHTFVDFWRKDKRIVYVDEQLTEEKISQSAESEFFTKHEINEWFKGIQSLSIQKRNAIILRDYYHFSYQEIANILDTTLANVKVTIFRARKEVQKYLALSDKE